MPGTLQLIRRKWRSGDRFKTVHKIMRGRPRAMNRTLPSVISTTLAYSGALAHQPVPCHSTGCFNSQQGKTGHS
jgi:hypothetical protein